MLRNQFGRNPHAIDKAMSTLRNRGAYTPDFKDLKKDYGNLFPVMVVDSFRKGRVDNHLLQDFPYFGQCVTLEDSYCLMKYGREESFLILESGESKKLFNLQNGNFKRVEGDVYGVPLDYIYVLDNIYKNGEKHQRLETPVMLLDQPNNPLINNCLFYCGCLPYWKNNRYDPKNGLSFAGYKAAPDMDSIGGSKTRYVYW